MKFIRLLATLLLVAVCAGFSSCEEELEEEPPTILKPEGGNNSSDLENTYSQYIDDYKNMTCKRFNDNGDTIEFTGITAKGYLMINLFQEATKKKVFDWVDNVKIDTICKVYKGYGEYEEVTVKSIGLSHAHGNPHIESNKNFITLLDFFGGESPFTRILFVNGGNSKMSNIMPIGSWSINTFITNWYNNEYSFIHDCCYTLTGDTVYTIKYENYDFYNIREYEQRIMLCGSYDHEATRISCEEGIGTYVANFSGIYQFNSCKINYKDCKQVWERGFTLPFNYEANAKLSYSIVNKSANVWEYKVDIIYYDGTKKDYTFYLNIDNGVISENPNASPLIGKWLYTTEAGNKEIITFNGDNTGNWESVDIYDNTSNTDTFAYTVNGNEVIIDFGDGSLETYRYEIVENEMKLTYEDGHTEVYTKQ